MSSSTGNFSGFVARLRRFMTSAVKDCGLEGSHANAASCENSFNHLALELFALQFEHNRAYQEFCERKSLRPSAVESWRQIPAVPAAAFKELEMSCLGA